MYHPWEADWLDEVEYDSQGLPFLAYTLDDLAQLSLKWIDEVISYKAMLAQDEIINSAERHNRAMGTVARRVGMLCALSAAVAECQDGKDPVFDSPAWQPKPLTRWERLKYSRYAPRRIGRCITGHISQGLRAAARWLDDHTHGW